MAARIVAVMDEREPYPVPEATIAGDPNVLVAILAAILGVLFFWRRKAQVGGGPGDGPAGVEDGTALGVGQSDAHLR